LFDLTGTYIKVCFLAKIATTVTNIVLRPMPKYVLTGVDGKLGSVAADYAAEIASPEQKLVFTSFKLDNIPADKLKYWREKGAEVTTASYDDPASLEKVFTGAEAIPFISTWLFGETRRRQHKTVVDTAKACGVRRICYTSFIGAGLEENLPFLPQDHKYTESIIYASGLEYNIQRNYLYADNIPQLFAPAWKYCGNKWMLNSKGVPAAYVAREDCSRVAAALLLGKGEPNTVYDVTGPEAISDYKIFEYICSKTGLQAEIVEMTDADLDKYWGGKGLPRTVFEDFSNFPMKLCVDDITSCGDVVGRGLMSEVSNTVEKLTGRKPLSVWKVIEKYEDILPKQ
jgi:NAD(P)H dehydrogenase (quinone)